MEAFGFEIVEPTMLALQVVNVVEVTTCYENVVVATSTIITSCEENKILDDYTKEGFAY